MASDMDDEIVVAMPKREGKGLSREQRNGRRDVKSRADAKNLGEEGAALAEGVAPSASCERQQHTTSQRASATHLPTSRKPSLPAQSKGLRHAGSLGKAVKRGIHHGKDEAATSGSKFTHDSGLLDTNLSQPRGTSSKKSQYR